jgi:hypothetical protein
MPVPRRTAMARRAARRRGRPFGARGVPRTGLGARRLLAHRAKLERTQAILDLTEGMWPVLEKRRERRQELLKQVIEQRVGEREELMKAVRPVVEQRRERMREIVQRRRERADQFAERAQSRAEERGARGGQATGGGSSSSGSRARSRSSSS